MRTIISWMAFNRDFTASGDQISTEGFTNIIHKDIYEAHRFDKHLLVTASTEPQLLKKKCYIMREFLKDQYPRHAIEIMNVGITEDELQNFEKIESALRSMLQQIGPEQDLSIIAGSGPTTLNMVWASLKISMGERFKLFLPQRAEHTIEGKKTSLVEIKPFASARLDDKLREFHINQALPKDIYIDSYVKEEYERATIIAKAPEINVLILGETGCGKDVLANHIYKESPINDQPYMAINCASLQDEILYSELFGHEAGAFTDAKKQHIGLFETCKGGTLFLDEIGDISPYMQQSLLRALENKEIKRLGSNKVIKNIQVRIIAATNNDLYQKCKDGKFRWDLYYRLCSMELYLRPYRQRSLKERQAVLAHYLKTMERRWGYKAAFAPKAHTILEQYAFPGNFREIYNTLNGLFALRATTIDTDCLPKRFFDQSTEIDDTYEGALKRHCLAVFEKNHHNIAKTCTALGYGNSTQLKKKLKDWGAQV